MDEDFARLVFRRYLKDYGWVFELSRRHDFPALTLDQLVKLVEKSQLATSEGERFSFSLILAKQGMSFAPAPVKVSSFHLSKTGRLSDLKNAVDGVNACYLVDKAGMLSIVEVPSKVRRKSASETMIELSKDKGLLTVYVGTNLSRVFSNGELIRTLRKASWLEPCDVKFDQLIKDGYPEWILSELMSICVDLSESAKSGTIVLQPGNALASCQPFREIAFNECDLKSLPREQLLNFAAIDGAIIVTVKGRILGIAQRLIYPEWGTGIGGARHESAARYSAHQECAIFVVSSDGPISIFRQGSLWHRCFADLKP